ncbi:MAG TPA: spherulation-specific family 4 protein [Streptosporangiaceae bacterium]
MPDVIGEEPSGPPIDPCDQDTGGTAATSRRAVLRDFGSVLSAAAIMPMVSTSPLSASSLSSAAGYHGGGGGNLSSMLVPAYFHPAQFPAEWAALADPRLLGVVLNVNDGPGDAREPEFVSAVFGIEAAGGTVTGYVDAGFGARSEDEMRAAARRYRDWYGVADIFLDQVPAGAATLDAYRALGAQLRDRGTDFLVFNHGVYPDPGYAAVADLLVTFEGPWSAYQVMDAPPAWAAALPAWRFCHLVYDVPPPMLDQAVRLADQRGAGVLYVTDGQGVNPWNGLPGYFDRELTLVCGE